MHENHAATHQHRPHHQTRFSTKPAGFAQNPSHEEAFVGKHTRRDTYTRLRNQQHKSRKTVREVGAEVRGRAGKIKKDTVCKLNCENGVMIYTSLS